MKIHWNIRVSKESCGGEYKIKEEGYRETGGKSLIEKKVKKAERTLTPKKEECHREGQESNTEKETEEKMKSNLIKLSANLNILTF